MSRRASYVVPLLALVVVSLLLAAGGFAVLRWVWSQGYMASQLATPGEEMPSAWGYPMRPFGVRGYFCAPTLLFIVGGLLLLGMIGKWVHMWTRHRAMRRYGHKAMWWGPGGRHWHHGPMPPWFWGWPEEEPAEEPTGDETEDATSTTDA